MAAAAGHSRPLSVGMGIGRENGVLMAAAAGHTSRLSVGMGIVMAPLLHEALGHEGPATAAPAQAATETAW